MRKKIIAILTASACTMLSVLPVSAGNTTDRNFSFQLPVYNGIGIENNAREKWDDTSTYVCYKAGPWDTYFMVFGSKTNENSPDVSTLVNCTIGGKAKVGVGEEREVRQYVNEWNFPYAYLGGSSQYYPEEYAVGRWSPDCAGSYPWAN